jgi:hypothetical protein
MWRRTERVSLEKKPSTGLSQEPLLGRKDEFEAPRWLTGKPGTGLFRDVGGMIIEDQPDCRVGRIGGVKKVEKFDEGRVSQA